ncbi:MAG: hypothetical protein CVV27_13570 [Candidatus Melainabacteria bacterium HGW-Melainabacteria-1]|nr:MAG: hypothetical protein CVV27_13570 [Candidatus Melainabacteria bacterium HGW-Melainabacteria-1]
MPLRDGDRILRSELETFEPAGLLRALAGLEQVLAKPLAMKAMVLNYHLDLLARMVPDCLLIWLRRDPLFVAASVLQAKRKLYGTIDEWFSFRSDEYEQLITRSPYEQVAGQIHYTDAAIARGLAALPTDRKLVVSYDRFCENPAAVYEQLRARYRQRGHEIGPYNGEARFQVSQPDIAPDERRCIEAALAAFGLVPGPINDP